MDGYKPPHITVKIGGGEMEPHGHIYGIPGQLHQKFREKLKLMHRIGAFYGKMEKL